MKYFAICGIISMLFLASSSATDCESSLPKKVCEHLAKLETKISNLAVRSTSLIAKAVEVSAERNAKLFAHAVELVKNASSSQQGKNTTDLIKVLAGLKERFKKVKAAQAQTYQDALEAIEAAATKVADLVEKILKEAAEGDHSDAEKFRKRLNNALRKAHLDIRKSTLQAVRKVAQSNQKMRRYVVEMLKDLGLELATKIESLVSFVSDKNNEELAENTEHEIDEDFDAAVNEAYSVVIMSDSGVSKRGWSEFWAKVKAKFQQLGAMILAKIREAIKIIKPQIYEKLRDIGRIILNAAKKVIVEIAGQMFLIPKDTF